MNPPDDFVTELMTGEREIEELEDSEEGVEELIEDLNELE